MVCIGENALTKGQRQPMFETVDDILVGVELNLNDSLYVIHTYRASVGDAGKERSPRSGRVKMNDVRP